MAELLGSTSLNQDQRGLCNTLDQSGRLLLLLVNDLLDFSKVEAGKVELEQAPFSLKQAIANVDSLMRPLALVRNIDFITSTNKACPDWVTGDCERSTVLVSLTP